MCSFLHINDYPKSPCSFAHGCPLEYKVLEGALCWSPHTQPLVRHSIRRRPAANTCAGRGHAQGSKQGHVKVALGRASTAEGHRRETAHCEARWAHGAGGRAPLYLREPQVSRPVSFTHLFIQPLLYGAGSTTGSWAGRTGQGAGDRKGTGEGGPAVTGRNGSPERRFLERVHVQLVAEAGRCLLPVPGASHRSLPIPARRPIHSTKDCRYRVTPCYSPDGKNSTCQ